MNPIHWASAVSLRLTDICHDFLDDIRLLQSSAGNPIMLFSRKSFIFPESLTLLIIFQKCLRRLQLEAKSPNKPPKSGKPDLSPSVVTVQIDGHVSLGTVLLSGAEFRERKGAVGVQLLVPPPPILLPAFPCSFFLPRPDVGLLFVGLNLCFCPRGS